MIIMTIMMIEAAGSVDDNTMTPLPGKQIDSATKFSKIRKLISNLTTYGFNGLSNCFTTFTILDLEEKQLKMKWMRQKVRFS